MHIFVCFLCLSRRHKLLKGLMEFIYILLIFNVTHHKHEYRYIVIVCKTDSIFYGLNYEDGK